MKFDSHKKKLVENKPESRKGIFRLIGSALPKDGDVNDIDDERLKYLLSK